MALSVAGSKYEYQHLSQKSLCHLTKAESSVSPCRADSKWILMVMKSVFLKQVNTRYFWDF